jgi:hypothetical protein
VAISSQGTTFAFAASAGTFYAKVLSISIEEAQPEIVDMTAVDDPLTVKKIVATGDILSPAKVSIEYLRGTADLALAAPATTIATMASSGAVGTLSIAHPAFSVTEQAVLESASTEMSVGDGIRGRMTFAINGISY